VDIQGVKIFTLSGGLCCVGFINYIGVKVGCLHPQREREREKKVGGGSERHYRLEGGVTET
jgi:hypothetical protein